MAIVIITRVFYLHRSTSLSLRLCILGPYRHRCRHACVHRTQGRAFEVFPGYTEEETDTIYANMLDALCTPMKIGTHYQATSTNDPTFWVIHPTFDRSGFRPKQ